ncbi:NUDIX domain-containing protein [Chlorogloeopsis sp. ULAP01]|uniref:NUDIX hydrolase n=1 Tax=Chlorogloeopsis sp. ULAP01 TaxID=3056483 RepID=UPI0025AB5772|nr:NUDIX domain-containing protein [Chlorogloeopsis sp. ULAP01]MDM9380852.1 NUDIX domain-containing protein [Chlorogloeopsis sp. ULAP01]
MKKTIKIRVKVFGLIRDENRIFVSEDYDSVKQQKYYRALGGSIEFGETSCAALEREFQEEIQAELKNIRYRGCLENLFTLEGKPGHEIVQVYECEFINPKFYQLQELVFVEPTHNSQHKALWIDIARVKSGELRLGPEDFCDYL